MQRKFKLSIQRGNGEVYEKGSIEDYPLSTWLIIAKSYDRTRDPRKTLDKITELIE